MTATLPPPAATVQLTLMFVDIEGSTTLLQDLGDAYAALLLRYRDLVDAAVTRFGGKQVSVSGDGFFHVFPDPEGALEAAVTIQQGLESGAWPMDVRPRARIGIHAGHVRRVDEGYVGLDVHRAARIGDAGNGGQILLSRETVEAIGQDRLQDRVVFRDLGAHRLKGLRYPEVLFDAVPVGSPAGPVQLRTIDRQPNNLPRPAGQLVGRGRELASLSALLTDQATRLVTITGPGGMGKTRLALELAQELLGAFPAGVFLVELAGVEDQALVDLAIAQTLGLRDSFFGGALEALLHHLRHARMLLLLDNFEQVIEARGVVDTLLASCPQLQVLVTSREPLSSVYERLFPLDALACPPPEAAVDPGEAAASPAVQLFLERALEKDPHFTIDEHSAPVISEICRRLDGLPLAIELAASRARLLSPQELLHRITRRLDLLKGGPERDQRHRTLWAAIAWSHRLLSPPEQQLLQALAVFQGGMRIETAEAVCGGLPWLEGEILDGLGSLLDKSLLCQKHTSGERRLGMLETIRQFAQEKLAAEGKLEVMRERHGRHFIALAEAMAPRLLTSDQRVQVNCLLDEQDNLREALVWSMERSDADDACRLVSALLWFWISRGLFAEGIGWVDRGLRHAESIGSPRAKASMLDAAGWLRILSGDYAGALPHCRRAHDLFHRHGEPADIARTKMTLGITLAVTGDEASGPPLMVEALAMFRELGDDNGTALALIALGEGSRAGGDMEGAEALYREALEKLSELDNVYWPAHLLQNLAHMRLEAGDAAAARDFLTRSLDHGRTYDYPMITTLSLSALAGVARALGQAETAARVLGLTRRRLEEMGAHFEPLDRIAHERYIGLTREQLGAERYDGLEAEGMHWSLTEALETARSLGCEI